MKDGVKQVSTIAVSAETKKELDVLRKELGARTYEELLRRLLDSLGACREVMAREKVLKVLCDEFLETNASLSVWVKLLAKRLDSKEEVAMASDYLIPNPNEDGMYIMNREMCLPVAPKRRAVAAPSEGAAAAGSEPERRAGGSGEATPRPETAAAETEAEAQTRPPGPAPKEAEVGAGESVEDYVSNVLLPLIKERVGDRTALTLKELRKLIESLTTLPPNEIIDVMLNLGIAELSGNQVTLKLK